ncbi:MAG: flagellar biosynthetic protein FliR [Deltaproteobacteria bacterium]|nr:flagellar biosynthetic protein FliR [Deltaproteobacteria bacterium]
MNDLLKWLGGDASVDQTVLVAILVTARVIPLTHLTPWLALSIAPNPLIVAVSVVLAVLLTPYALGTAPEISSRIVDLSLLAARELLIGTVFAVAAAMPFIALAWAGRLTDTIGDRSITDNATSSVYSAQTPLSNLYAMMGMVLFFSLGGHRLAVSALTKTFITLPIAATMSAPTLSLVVWESVRLIADALALSLVLTAPVAAIVALCEIALGFFGRSFPHLSFSYVAAMPLRAFVALGAVCLCVSFIMDLMPQIFRDAFETASELIKRMGR